MGENISGPDFFIIVNVSFMKEYGNDDSCAIVHGIDHHFL